jgi:hypothetical protein
MSAETQLYAALTGAAGLAALVSARVYPDVVPLGVALPAVAYLRAETEYSPTLHGTIWPGSTRAVMDVACVATTRSSAEAVADAVVVACLAATHMVTSRAMQFDAETDLYAVTLSVDVWE